MNHQALRPTAAIKPMFYFTTGLGVLALNKVRYWLLGYRRPRSFDASDIERSIAYDFEVVKHWKKYLQEYTGLENPLAGRTVLELGPGADIGVGAILLEHGARAYYAIDVNDLMRQMPADFCAQMKSRLSSQDVGWELDRFASRQSSRLNYLIERQFNLDCIRDFQVDLVASQAAFEHFDDVRQTVEQLSRNVAPGTLFLAEVDLQAHSRWIRERDPNNIYRYPLWLYRLLHYSGIPNRIRPEKYQELLEHYGWTDVKLVPRTVVDGNTNRHTLAGLSKEFIDKDMTILTVIVLATKR